MLDVCKDFANGWGFTHAMFSSMINQIKLPAATTSKASPGRRRASVRTIIISNTLAQITIMTAAFRVGRPSIQICRSTLHH